MQLQNVQLTGMLSLEAVASSCGKCNYFVILHYEGKVKSFRPSLRETRDKWVLGRDPDKSWCHRHTSSMIKLFCSQSMGIGSSIGQEKKFSAQTTTDVKLAKDPWAAIKKALHQCGGHTSSCPGPYPTDAFHHALVKVYLTLFMRYRNL